MRKTNRRKSRKTNRRKSRKTNRRKFRKHGCVHGGSNSAQNSCHKIKASIDNSYIIWKYATNTPFNENNKSQIRTFILNCYNGNCNIEYTGGLGQSRTLNNIYSIDSIEPDNEFKKTTIYKISYENGFVYIYSHGQTALKLKCAFDKYKEDLNRTRSKIKNNKSRGILKKTRQIKNLKLKKAPSKKTNLLHMR